MLRIITQIAEATTELQRISDRTHNQQTEGKEVAVREILKTVQTEGDQALLDYTEKFDQLTLTVDQLRVTGSELDAAYQQVSKELIDAIALARPNLGWSLVTIKPY